jgi:hypothetical protein
MSYATPNLFLLQSDGLMSGAIQSGRRADNICILLRQSRLRTSFLNCRAEICQASSPMLDTDGVAAVAPGCCRYNDPRLAAASARPAATWPALAYPYVQSVIDMVRRCSTDTPLIHFSNELSHLYGQITHVGQCVSSLLLSLCVALYISAP